MIDDRVLVSRIINGDMQAFRLLIAQHERLVIHMIGRLVDNKEDREELCQDVFVRVHGKLKEFNFQSKISTWIATIAYRHAINYLRKKRIVISELPSVDVMAIEDAEANFAENDMEERILKLVELLPVHYKTILTLFHLDNKNYQEIQSITGLPEGTVKNYLFRARALLKEKVMAYLSKEEIL